jgi:hypothetical protein
MPDGFSWYRIADEYVRKVRGIVKATPELRSILIEERMEAIEQSNAAIERNTAQLRGILPGFDIQCYRNSLQDTYGHLKLNTLDSTDQQYKLRLWNMFIPQSVREALAAFTLRTAKGRAAKAKSRSTTRARCCV